MSNVNKSIEDMTQEEIEAVLDKKRAAKARQQEKEKAAYEQARDKTVSDIMQKALGYHEAMRQFKAFCHTTMEEQAVSLDQYGKMSAKSKGGFSITDSTGNLRVTRRRDTEPHWDERSVKAAELIKSFLSDTIKKRDLDLYEILMGFLEKNSNGDMEYARVMNLYQHESKFNDARWQEGLRLIKESYTTHLKAFGYEFKNKGADGKWQNVLLNFSSL